MKFLSIKDLRTKSSQIWQHLPEEKEMVITNNGKPVAILSALSDENFEESLASIRQARVSEAIMTLQRESVRRGVNNLRSEDINEEIAAVRGSRNR